MKRTVYVELLIMGLALLMVGHLSSQIGSPDPLIESESKFQEWDKGPGLFGKKKQIRMDTSNYAIEIINRELKQINDALSKWEANRFPEARKLRDKRKSDLEKALKTLRNTKTHD